MGMCGRHLGKTVLWVRFCPSTLADMGHKMELTVSLIVVLGLGTNVGATGFQGRAQKELTSKWFIGTWEATRKQADIPKIVVFQQGGVTLLQVWARASRTVVEWPRTTLVCYSDSVAGTQFSVASASWDLDFGKTTWTLRVQGDRLVVEYFTQFTDKSGRSNYCRTANFRRMANPRR